MRRAPGRCPSSFHLRLVHEVRCSNFIRSLIRSYAVDSHIVTNADQPVVPTAVQLYIDNKPVINDSQTVATAQLTPVKRSQPGASKPTRSTLGDG
jgi:hypothetical protein